MCICQWLHKFIQVLLMFDNVISNAHEIGFVESLGFTVCLWMIRCCCQKFNSEEGAHSSKTFADKSSNIVYEDVRWNAERDEPMIKRRHSI